MHKKMSVFAARNADEITAFSSSLVRRYCPHKRTLKLSDVSCMAFALATLATVKVAATC
jgi:hypothetical protein